MRGKSAVEFPIRREYEIELKVFQKGYGAGNSEKYDLSDKGQAIRFLIDFAIEMKDRELAIFKVKRFHSCGRGETSNQGRFAEDKKMGVGR